MLRHPNIDRICAVVLVLTLLVTGGYMAVCASGLITGERVMGYETRLFDQSRVHTINIVMDDWDAFIDTAQSETYTPCTIVIDGETYANAAIRGKGNTSLSRVSSYGSERYSFKVEFDHYQSGMTYHGLDKLSLNNLIQDPTCMKDYLAYTLMDKMGVASPLCSFVEISVNGEPWGLYLAVEAVEDSFLTRNYGAGHGELYKPDSLSMGGGRGNGMDFDMDAFTETMNRNAGQTDHRQADDAPDASDRFPGAFTGERNGRRSSGDNPGIGGMGSADVKLQYVDDDPASYPNIFDNAKTDVNDADKARLVTALRTLSDPVTATSAVDQDAVIRYFAVHHFLCNDDSYTGSMIHNYYLYEEDGMLSMIPWDYNLAFGGFGGGSDATSLVNRPVDEIVASGDASDRPMAAWITADEASIAQYHAVYAQMMTDVFASGWFEEEFDRVAAMIAPYVQDDPTAFYTYAEHTAGVEALRSFCLLRAQSVTGQLGGAIPTTSAGQAAEPDALIDASHLTLSDMGDMGGGEHGGGRPTDRGDGRTNGMGGMTQPEEAEGMQTPTDMGGMTQPEGVEGMQPPTDMGGMTRPEGTEGMQPPTGMGGMMQPEGTEGMQPPIGMGGMTQPEGTEGMQPPTGMGGMTQPEEAEGMQSPTDMGGMTQPEEAEGMQPPTGGTGMTGMTQPGVDPAAAGRQTARASGAARTASGTDTPVMLLACAAVLAAALVLAWKIRSGR